MAVTVDYRHAQLELRINGYLFPQVLLATFTYEKVLRYSVMVEDPTFGRFEVTSNMIVEWKTEGRWYQTKPQLVVDHLLNHRGGQYGTEVSRRDRKLDGSGNPEPRALED